MTYLPGCVSGAEEPPMEGDSWRNHPLRTPPNIRTIETHGALLFVPIAASREVQCYFPFLFPTSEIAIEAIENPHGERPTRRAARRTRPRRIDETVGDELPAGKVPWPSGANRTRHSQVFTVDRALAICCRSAGETRRVKTVRDGGRRRSRHPERFRGFEFRIRPVRCRV